MKGGIKYRKSKYDLLFPTNSRMMSLLLTIKVNVIAEESVLGLQANTLLSFDATTPAKTAGVHTPSISQRGVSDAGDHTLSKLPGFLMDFTPSSPMDMLCITRSLLKRRCRRDSFGFTHSLNYPCCYLHDRIYSLECCTLFPNSKGCWLYPSSALRAQCSMRSSPPATPPPSSMN